MKTTPPARSLWPVSITAFFILAVIFLGSYVVWAMHQREDLVSENYYEQEVRYQQQLDSLNRTHAAAPQAQVAYEPALRQIVVRLPAAATGRIQLYRPSDARLDRTVPVALEADGTQRIDARELATGLWKISVRWTAGGQDYVLQQPLVVKDNP